MSSNPSQNPITKSGTLFSTSTVAACLITMATVATCTVHLQCHSLPSSCSRCQQLQQRRPKPAQPLSSLFPLPVACTNSPVVSVTSFQAATLGLRPQQQPTSRPPSFSSNSSSDAIFLSAETPPAASSSSLQTTAHHDITLSTHDTQQQVLGTIEGSTPFIVASPASVWQRSSHQPNRCNNVPSTVSATIPWQPCNDVDSSSHLHRHAPVLLPLPRSVVFVISVKQNPTATNYTLALS